MSKVADDRAQLGEVARSVRLDVLEMTSRMGGHPTSCFSAVEILTRCKTHGEEGLSKGVTMLKNVLMAEKPGSMFWAWFPLEA